MPIDGPNLMNRTTNVKYFLFPQLWVALKVSALFGVLLLMLVGERSSVMAEGLALEIIQAAKPQTLNLVVGKSVVLGSQKPFRRASLANPEIATTLVLSPKQLYVSGKTLGVTNLTFWGNDGKVFAVYDVHIVPDIDQLKAQLHDLFPEEKDIQVRAAHDHITLAGSVSGPNLLTQVLDLAESYAPEKVKNLMSVQGVQQVMLEVKIAEMQRGLLRRLGVNITRLGQGLESYSIGTLNDLHSFSIDGEKSLFEFIPAAATNYVLKFGVGTDRIFLFLDALKRNNLTKILAEPTLMTVSGQEANFLAGGEFPVPIPQAFGVTTIDYKEFGVSLSFSPTVLSGGKISLKIAPEVSELDFSGGIQTQSFQIPAILTRKVETVIEIMDGQSFAIAGLMQDNIRETISKYPVLGDLPILGALFRSTSFQKNETELVIIVTAHLVKPLDMKTQTLPTDAYLEPNDFELMLMGYMEGRKRRPSPGSEHSASSETSAVTPPAPVRMGGGLEGQFGHLAP